ncbi:MAG: hypothetical protein U9Q81_15140 [Pseudomonadota bacterium]|nr:hypothetical protein [Pseudomonadota bacterium]
MQQIPDRVKKVGGRFESAVSALVVALVLCAPGRVAYAEAEDTPGYVALPEEEAPPSDGVKAADALAVRPVTFFNSLFSTGVFVVSLPFVALDPALSVRKSREELVDYPFGYTFKRPLGEFGDTEW